MSRRYIPLVLCALLVTACGHYEWVNRSGPNTDAEFNRSSMACQQEAARIYPFQSKTVETPGRYVPAQPAQTNCYNYSGNVQCQTTGGGGGYREASTYHQVDGNSGNRDEYWRTCMATKGWHRVYVDGSTKSPPAQPVNSQATKSPPAQPVNSQAATDSDTLRNLRFYANQGNASSMNELGIAYANGKYGLPIDHAQALAWYKKSADAGSEYGQANAGLSLLRGLHGIPVDNEAGFRFSEQAAKQANPIGMNTVGWCYENGRGVSQNIDQAVYWYKKAASYGNQTAADNLKRLGK